MMRMFWFLAALSAALLLPGVLKSHSWYPYECCSQMDCFPAPVARDLVERTDTGWRLKREGVVIPFDQTRASPDGQFHICRDQMGKGRIITPSGKLPCLWVPDGDG